MHSSQLVLVLVFVAFVALWSMTIWGGWAERYYAQAKDSRHPWFWLRAFSIQQTPRNCILFIKAISALGVLLVVGGVSVVLLGAHG